MARKTKEAEERGLEALRRKYRDKGLSEAQRAHNHVMVTKSITDTAPEMILNLYRQWWQIEPAFKRLKTILKYHEIPLHVEQSA
ncbi:MAG: transposase [Spirochaetaceae bacterium]|nr:transposase [Spirochaetaceae bacterium]